ncbi:MULTISPECIES: substrate-binding domain-containing protein [Mesorhizobium]|uniref:Ribose transport system substrate-binding protein n=1 Tax=Mesorhizobium shonense TaxID=1209948 RepID=A0ABV2HVI5_9HYPH|nr:MULTISPECIES: substrate-binding domain-containing protein [unclassified Mesorhizobium]AZO28342.1 sugar ABC transporter substrate-binding protein [Mesorhizobium sp. M1B.F.Ca.ET.045.04.1.1]RWA69043.1 MAG: sugar ABC transporter substrate-binding protein [Mesorhizobium sp.]
MTLTTTRRTFAAALGFTALGIFAGAVSPAVAQDQKTYALVQINQQALFFNQINQGAQKAADAAGAKLVIFNANNDAAAQNSAIETYIQQKVNGLIVVAIDVNGIMAAVNQAADAKIPVVAIDAILPKGPQKAQIGVDNAKAGADMGAHFLDYVKANMGGKAKIGIVGALNSYIQNVRQKGFEDAIKGKDGIETIAVVDGQNVQDTALAAAENLITGNPDMNAIYATGEPALLGAIAAVESQGKQDQIKIFGWDLTAQAISGIDKGYVTAVVQQDPAGMGEAAVKALDTITRGGSVDKNVAVPVTIVTKDNVEPYRAVFK